MSTQDQGIFPTLTPYLVVSNAEKAIEFYVKALGAISREVMKSEDGKVMNAQLEIGTSVLMLNDEFPDWGVFGPKEGETVHMTIHIRSHNIQADWDRAIAAGATETTPLADQFWGDRYGQFSDPFGYKWSMGQPLSELK